MGKKIFMCVNCGKEYKSYKPNSKYCSIKCRREYLNFKCTCDYCGKEFSVMKNRIDAIERGVYKNMFCSRKCATDFQRNSFTKTCKNCGNEFTVPNVFKDIQKYCSHKCYVDFKNNHSKILINTCPNCGRIYKTYHKEQTYCSRECARIASRLNPESPVPPENINIYIRQHLHTWRRKVLEKADYKCCLTGKDENLVAHHCRSFNLLMQETANNLNFQFKEHFSEYSEDELELFLNSFLELQESYSQYVCITESIHKLFHGIYGYGNNTIDQWNEFVEKFNNGEFEYAA